MNNLKYVLCTLCIMASQLSTIKCEEDNPFLNLFKTITTSLNNALEEEDNTDDTPEQEPQMPFAPQPVSPSIPMPIPLPEEAPEPEIAHPMLQKTSFPIKQSSFFQAASSRLPEVRGAIKHPKNAAMLPRFRVIFNGQETMSNQEGFFTFPSDVNLSKYSILLCKQINQNFDKNNTLRYISVPANQPYRYFVFSKSIWEEQWEQQEKRLPAQSRKIPSYTIIVFIDPTLVEKLDEWNVSFPSNINKLPLIVLKSSTTPATLNTASADSILKSLDTTVFHQPIKQVMKSEPTKDQHKIALSVVHE